MKHLNEALLLLAVDYFTKSSILDVWQDFESASEKSPYNVSTTDDLEYNLKKHHDFKQFEQSILKRTSLQIIS